MNYFYYHDILVKQQRLLWSQQNKGKEVSKQLEIVDRLLDECLDGLFYSKIKRGV